MSDVTYIVNGVRVDPNGNPVSESKTEPTRADLDAEATALGVENPEKLPNKDAVVAAIAAKRAEGGGDSA